MACEPSDLSGSARDPGDAAPMSVEDAFLGAMPNLRRYVRRLLGADGSGADIEDIVQETYVRARKAKQDASLSHATAYLFRVARNLSFRERVRRKSAVLGLIEDFAAQQIIDDVTPADDHLYQKRRLEVFQDAVRNLPPQCRHVFILRQFEGLSHKEISARLGISTSTVEKHLAKGLRLCAAALKDRGYGEDRSAAEERDVQRFGLAGE